MQFISEQNTTSNNPPPSSSSAASSLTPTKAIVTSAASVSIFGNSIQKSIQKAKTATDRRKRFHQNNSEEYLCSVLDTICKKRVNEDESSHHAGSSKKQCLSSSKSAIKPPPSPSIKLQDRFIPNRANVDAEFSYFALEKSDNIENVELEQIMTPGQRKLKEQLNHLKSDQKRLIDCRKSLTPAFERVENFTDQVKNFKESIERMTPKKTVRTFPSLPVKVLDAPDLVNDYYLNLLHWGQNNILSVALAQTVYLWNSDDGTIQTMTTLEDEQQYVSAVQWSPDASFLAVGTSYNTIQLWDAKTRQKVREFTGHANRISSLAWQSGNVFSSGGKDSLIINHDHRMRRPIINYFTGHTQEVCGLTWSPDGSTLASGGNENMLCFWDMNFQQHSHRSLPSEQSHGLSQQSYAPRIKLDQHHIAAVKALAWCPWQRNILASGGGTADRNIKIWNAENGKCIKSVDTGSQVCALQWSDHYKELVSSHGFSDYQLIVWKYQDMTKVN